MYGTALIDLYSSNYTETSNRKSNNSICDGNGNTGTIVKNKKKINIVKDKKLSGLRSLLFESNNQKQSNDPSYAYHALSDYTPDELLVNISEEEEKIVNDDQQKVANKQSDEKKRRNNSEYKSASDGDKMRQFINQIPKSGSMNVLNNDTRQNSNASQHQIDFGKVIARFPMIYVGQKFLDKKFTLPMVRWLVSELRREVLPLEASIANTDLNLSSNSNSNSNSFSLIHSSVPKRERKKIWFEITDRCILGFDRKQSGFDQLSKSFTADSEKEAFSRMNVLNEGYLFLHKKNWICKIQAQPHEDGDLYSFAYLTQNFGCAFGQNNAHNPYTLHIFECDDKQIVNPELQRSEELGMSSADSLLPREESNTSSLVDNILGNSQQYEVMYCGKVRLAQKIALPSFIDETVDYWKQTKQSEQTKSTDKLDYKSNEKTGIIPILSIDNETTQNRWESEEDKKLNRKLSICKEEHASRSMATTDSDPGTYQKNHLHLPSNHSLITNTQSLDESTRESILCDLKEVKQSNTQLSPKKQAQKINLNNIGDHLLTDNLNDLGEIKRSSSAKCSSSGHTSKLSAFKLQTRTGARLRSTSGDTRMNKQASLKNSAHEEHLNNSRSNISSPNKFEDKENNFNFNNRSQSVEQTIHPNSKSSLRQSNTKQRSLPVPSIADQQEINPNKGLFNIFMKIGNQNKSGNTSDENLGNLNSSSSNSSNAALSSGSLNQSRHDSIDKEVVHDQPSSILKQSKQTPKQRSLEKTIEFSTSTTLFPDSNKSQEISLNSDEEKDKLYDENGQFYGEADEFEEELVSWRKQIFSSIQSNTRHLELSGNEMKTQTKSVTFDSGGLFTSKTRKRTREELRELWRKAIYQQILLIKMEKENLLLQENQHEAEDKRLKLDYEDIIGCSNTEEWTQILARCEAYALTMANNELAGKGFDCFGNTQNYNLTKYSSFLNSAVSPREFSEAIQNGCPKVRRGEIWYLLADIRQRNGVRPICSQSEASVDFNTNYRVLLQQLTSQQHAILVDLGRTFPRHPYFTQSLGSGQLCLFNLLKAYSLFDKEVGYCQGLSFVAGILLIHMSEDDAFEMMKHLLFFLGLRKQYKPDMSALQMQFYQLTRLLYDHHRDIYEHFEKFDISPVLYASPWFLTLFASQFSISFVSRVFDFIFLFGLEAIFRVSLSLLAIHKQSLLNCNCFESIIYFIKNDLVETETSQLESMFNIAFALDITRQLLVYEIEYQVIQEEMQYQPLTITYDRLKTVKEQPDIENSVEPSTTTNNKSKQSALRNSSSSTHLKTNQPKVRKISCSAIAQPPSPYHHLKQRKISSSVAVGTSDSSCIDFLTDTQSNSKIKELEKENKNQKNRIMEILDQLHVAQSSVYSLESSLDSYKSTVKLLERRVRALEDERDALLHMVSK